MKAASKMMLRCLPSSARALLPRRALSTEPKIEAFWHRVDAGDGERTMLLGVKEEWIEEMIQGEVDSIVSSSASDALSIEYSGLSYSEADELYHSVWSNTEGTVELSVDSLLPENVEMVGPPEINQAILKRPFSIDESTWIFRVKTKSR